MQAERAPLWQNSTSAVFFASVALPHKRGDLCTLFWLPPLTPPASPLMHKMVLENHFDRFILVLSAALILASEQSVGANPLMNVSLWGSAWPHIPSPGQRAAGGLPHSFHAPSSTLLNPSIHLPTYVRRQLQAGHKHTIRVELVDRGRLHWCLLGPNLRGTTDSTLRWRSSTSAGGGAEEMMQIFISLFQPSKKVYFSSVCDVNSV